ncbi:MAG TPA: bifunctional riboflavin kinase/FAD synthetase [Usitatibacteraceae bacterium]
MGGDRSFSLRLYRSLDPLGQDQGLALAIGNFDGVHRGHQAILQATVEASRRGGLTAAALSFHPLPREYFAKVRGDESLAPPRLMSSTEKLAAFHRAGIHHAFLPAFNAGFAAQSPADFIARLVEMKVRWLMVGEDFRFGARRAGDTAALRAAGLQHGFAVETMADIVDVADGVAVRVSSTAVREALAAGRLAEAARMLGRRYAITGRVTHGKKLGRTLGFPTANVSLGGRKPALAGVFAVKLRLVTRGLEGVASRVGDTLSGVANLGTNPAVRNQTAYDGRHHLEVFLFDYSGDLYGRRVEVEFFEKVRDEQNFASLDALVVQMHDDCSEAKRILRGT